MTEFEAISIAEARKTTGTDATRAGDQNGGTHDTGSVASSRASRPWNRDSNYPWNDESLKLDVELPPEKSRSPSSVSKIPKFKLKIHRASTSTTGTGWHTRSRASSDGTTSCRRDSSQISRKSPKSRFRAKQKLAIGPSQENSSRSAGNAIVQSRFVESFDTPPHAQVVMAPATVTLIPASPQEARSFFSDDSSRAGQKRGFMKRLSDFKARRGTSTPTGDVSTQDRKLINATFGQSRSRASGRTSTQDNPDNSSHASKTEGHRLGALSKARFWWSRGKHRLRARRGTVRGKNKDA